MRELPRVPSALALLGGVLARLRGWHWLLVSNAGLLLTLLILFTGWTWLLAVLLLVAIAVVRYAARRKTYGLRGLGMGALLIVSTLGPPWVWTRDLGRETTPPVLSVREATDLPHRRAVLFRFRDGVIRTDLGHSHGTRLYPVVPKDWRPEEQVTVFAVRTPGTGQNQSTLGGTAIPVNHTLRNAAITLALAQRFAVHPHVRFVDFSRHPDELLGPWGQAALPLLLWGSPNLLWLGVVLTRWIQKLRQSRRVLALRILRDRRRDR